MQYWLYSLAFLFILSSSTSLEGQTLPRDEYFNSEMNETAFDSLRWQQVISDIDYTEVNRSTRDEDFSNDTTSTNRRQATNFSSRNRNSSFWAFFFKVLLIGGLVATLVIVVANMMGNGRFGGPRSRKIKRGEALDPSILDNIEERIHETDLERWIREALEQENFALAIRLYYLAGIKELSLRRAIRWKKDKTNRDYLSELYNTSIYEKFREVTRIFERVWYGKGEITRTDYDALAPNFEEFVRVAGTFVKGNQTIKA